jgi:hypothetical protein
VVAGEDVAFRSFHVMVGQSLLVSAETIVGGTGALAGDVGDALASDVDEVAGGHLAHHDVVGADEVGGEVREVAIKEKVGRAFIAKLVEVFEAGLAGSDEENVDSATEEGANFLALDLGILLGGGEDEGAVAGAQHAAERFGELGEEGMGEVGDDEADGVGFSTGETAGEHVGLIVQLLHALEHALACFFTNVCVASEHLGDGDYGNSEIACNVLEPDCHIERIILQPASEPEEQSVPRRQV